MGTIKYVDVPIIRQSAFDEFEVHAQTIRFLGCKHSAAQPPKESKIHFTAETPEGLGQQHRIRVQAILLIQLFVQSLHHVARHGMGTLPVTGFCSGLVLARGWRDRPVRPVMRFRLWVDVSD